MATPDPESAGLVAKVVGGLVAIAAPIFGVWAYLEKRLDKKADKSHVATQFQDVKNELTIQRGHIGKVFDKLAEADAKNEERHRELLMHMLERLPGGKP